MLLAGELRELLDHHGARRHVDPDREGLGGEDDLDQTLDEARLDRLLERRDHPGVVGGDARLERGDELARSRAPPRSRGGDAVQVLVDDLPDPAALGRRWSAGCPASSSCRAASSHWLRLKMK